MRRLFSFFSLLLCAGACQWSFAQPAIVSAQAGEAALHAPHPLVIRAQGWLQDLPGAGDFAIQPATQTLVERRQGVRNKVVFVLSRDAADSWVLVVSERLLAESPAHVAAVVGQYERARRWMARQPEATAMLVAGASGLPEPVAREQLARQDFRVSRPGPALIEALRAVAGADTASIEAMIDDHPIRAAVRALENPAQSAALLTLR